MKTFDESNASDGLGGVLNVIGDSFRKDASIGELSSDDITESEDLNKKSEHSFSSIEEFGESDASDNEANKEKDL